MNITTIIPVHEFNESVEKLLKTALETVGNQEDHDDVEINLVYTSSIKKEIEEFVKDYENTNLHITLVENSGDTSFQAQVNLGVEKTKTDYFSILEFDDQVSKTYYKIGERYIKHFPDVDVFLPIVVETNDNEQALKLTNETVWSKSFVGENGELGYLNAKSLNAYTDFKICGAIIKKSEYENAGKLKTNISLTFQYEFLLRVLNNGGKIYTIPRIGYRHIATREGSLFDVYSKSLTLEERKFWFDTAKKESNFPTDREIDTSLLTT